MENLSYRSTVRESAIHKALYGKRTCATICGELAQSPQSLQSGPERFDRVSATGPNPPLARPWRRADGHRKRLPCRVGARIKRLPPLKDSYAKPATLNPLSRYWAWRDQREESGSGPHVYENWGRKWVFLVDLVLNEWTLGFGWDHDSAKFRYWSLHLGPVIVSWSKGGSE